MSQRQLFQVLPGGLATEEAQQALNEPLDFSLCAIAKIADERANPQIHKRLAEINMFLEFLPGKTVGIFEEDACAVCENNCTGSGRALSVRFPTTDLASKTQVHLETELLTDITPLRTAYPFLKKELDRTHKALEACLLADVIVDLHTAIVREPGAAPPRLDRRARLKELAALRGPIECQVCQEPIIRSAFNSPKCKYFGPVIRVCQVCERHHPKLRRRTIRP